MRVVIFLCCLAPAVLGQIQSKDPSACDGAEIRNGVGYKPHPTDCAQFIHCYYRDVTGSTDKRVSPVYRQCEFGMFWDQKNFRCAPSYTVDCMQDQCKKEGTTMYKYNDLNRCSAYLECQDGRAVARCCPDGHAFHPRQGCIRNEKCVDLCPFRDRVPGCNKAPISGAPTKFEQYTDNGRWVRENCPSGRMYSAADCDCSIEGMLDRDRVCKPDVKMTFDQGFVSDESGNNYNVEAENTQLFKGALYFNGKSALRLPALRPSDMDEGALVIMFKFKEDTARAKQSSAKSQMMVWNGHCRADGPTVMMTRTLKRRVTEDQQDKQIIRMGVETAQNKTILELPILEKKVREVGGGWNEIMYMFNKQKLNTRVCGATDAAWSYGELAPNTNCGLEFGKGIMAGNDGIHGYHGLIDDIYVYRCRPLDSVVNSGY